MSSSFLIGFHGKLPARGDFIGHGLPRTVIEPWDNWLARALSEAVRRLGPGWERLFRSAPAWRFALPGGLCGEAPLIGILMPSTDKVGRHYPFTVLASLPGMTDLALVPGGCAEWFTRAEAVVADACRAGADVAALPARLAILGRPIPDPGDGGPRRLVTDLLGDIGPDASLWWTRGGGGVEPSMVTCRGLPQGARATALLDGAWERWGWQDDHHPMARQHG